MKGLGYVLAIVGLIIVVVGVVNHFAAFFAQGQSHTSLYIAIAGAVILVIGGLLAMMGGRASA